MAAQKPILKKGSKAGTIRRDGIAAKRRQVASAKKLVSKAARNIYKAKARKAYSCTTASPRPDHVHSGPNLLKLIDDNATHALIEAAFWLYHPLVHVAELEA